MTDQVWKDIFEAQQLLRRASGLIGQHREEFSGIQLRVLNFAYDNAGMADDQLEALYRDAHPLLKQDTEILHGVGRTVGIGPKSKLILEEEQ